MCRSYFPKLMTIRFLRIASLTKEKALENVLSMQHIIYWAFPIIYILLLIANLKGVFSKTSGTIVFFEIIVHIFFILIQIRQHHKHIDFIFPFRLAQHFISKAVKTSMGSHIKGIYIFSAIKYSTVI